jgi:hypothetical protein
MMISTTAVAQPATASRTDLRRNRPAIVLSSASAAGAERERGDRDSRGGAVSPGPGHGPFSHGGGAPAAGLAESAAHGGELAASTWAGGPTVARPSAGESVIESGRSPARPVGKNQSAGLSSAAGGGSASSLQSADGAAVRLGPGVNHGSASPPLSRPSGMLSLAAGVGAAGGSAATALPRERVL